MKYYLLFISLLTTALMYAQDYKTCGTDEMMEKAFETDPTLRKKTELLKQEVNSYVKNRNPKNDDEIYVIPVVVHIIHNGGSNNISDAQVHDAMRIINLDYKKLNSDTSQVISEFTDIVANVGLEFKLAKLTPDGECTKGITRTYSELTNSAGENVKDLVKWDHKKYLNIWVVSNIESGAGGYSYLPGSAPNNDTNSGIVVRASQFGSIGASGGGNFSSRTLTHEIGHYLGLSHTWGGTNDSGLEENCSDDDGIEDTPNSIGSSGCNLSQNTCGSLDNVQNYMDYASCSKMFTEGQKSVMRGHLEYGFSNIYRHLLPTYENLMATGVHEDYNAPDCLANIEFYSTSSISCTEEEIEWENLSWNYDSALSYQWTFNGGNPSSSSEENPIITYSEPGSYDVSLSVTTSGGINTKTIEDAIYIQDQSDALIAPNTIHFNDNNLENWYIEDYFEGQTWSWNSAGSSSSEGSIRIRSSDFVDQGVPRKAYMPVFNLSNITPPCYLYYDYAYARKSALSEDELNVKISDDCGQTWINRLSKTTDDLTTTSSNAYFNFIPTETLWKEQRISLSSWTGESQVQALFEFSGSNGQYLYIDNIRFGVPNLSSEELTVNNLHLEVFPNPSYGDAHIKFNLLNPHMIELELIDVLGKEISSLSSNFNAGQHQLNLDALKPKLKPGLYFLNCIIGNYKETQQVIVY